MAQEADDKFHDQYSEWYQLLVLSAPQNRCGVHVEDLGWALFLTNTTVLTSRTHMQG